MGERRVRNAQAEGSSPFVSTTSIQIRLITVTYPGTQLCQTALNVSVGALVEVVVHLGGGDQPAGGEYPLQAIRPQGDTQGVP